MRILGTLLARPLTSSLALASPRARRSAWTGVARVVALVLLALPLAACDFLTGIPSTSRVEMTVTPTELSINQVAQASGTAFTGDGAVNRHPKRQVVYRSSNPAVVTVNASSGLVVAIANGTADVIGESDGKSTAVRVVVRPTPVKQVVIAPKNPTVRRGIPFGIAATPLDSNNTAVQNRPVAWRVLDPAILDITPAGIITPKAVGQTQLIASVDSGRVADTTTVRVTEVPITSVQLTPVQSVIYVGQTRQLTATLRDSVGTTVTGRPITWLVDDQLLVRVDQNGLVTGLAPTSGANGATITARLEQVPGLNTLISGSASVVVLAPAARMSVTPTFNLRTGQPNSTFIQVLDASGNALGGRTVRITSSDPSVVTAPSEVITTGSGASVFLTPGTVTGESRTATLTFQALDVSGNPQGAPGTTTVTVFPPL
jgi:uncharacterized protein YjdB